MNDDSTSSLNECTKSSCSDEHDSVEEESKEEKDQLIISPKVDQNQKQHLQKLKGKKGPVNGQQEEHKTEESQNSSDQYCSSSCSTSSNSRFSHSDEECEDPHQNQHSNDEFSLLSKAKRSALSKNFEKTKKMLVFIMKWVICLLVFMTIAFFMYYVLVYEDSHDESIYEIWSNDHEQEDLSDHFVETSNGLKVYFKQNTKTQLSGAAMTLQVGGLQDYKNATGDYISGVAYLAAELLIPWQKPVKDENGVETVFKLLFDRYEGQYELISQPDHTIFSFTCTPNGFDRIFQVFIQAFSGQDTQLVFGQSSNTKIFDKIDELQKKFEGKLKSDDYMQQIAMQISASAKHPFSTKYQGLTAKLKSLLAQSSGSNLQYHLSSFINNFYSSNLMSFFIYDKKPVANQKDIWLTQLRAINSQNIEKELGQYISSPLKPFEKSDLQKIIRYKSSKISKNEIQVLLMFPVHNFSFKPLFHTFSHHFSYKKQMEKVKDQYLIKPFDFLKFHLENKGEKSFTQFLRNMFYGTGVSITRISLQEYELFCVNFHLTKAGLLSINEIIRVFFSYVQNIKEFSITPENYKDLQKVSLIKYKYIERKEVEMDFIQRMSKNIQIFDPSRIYTGDQIFFQFDYKMILKFVDQLNPDNFNLYIGLNDFDVDLYSANKTQNSTRRVLHKEEKVQFPSKSKKMNLRKLEEQIIQRFLEEEHSTNGDGNDPNANSTAQNTTNSFEEDFILRGRLLIYKTLISESQVFFSEFEKVKYLTEQYPQQLLQQYQDVSIFVSTISDITLPTTNLLLPQDFQLISQCIEFLDSFSDETEITHNEYEKQLQQCFQDEISCDEYANYPYLISIQNFQSSQIYYQINRSYLKPEISIILLFQAEKKYFDNSENQVLLYLFKQLSFYQESKTIVDGMNLGYEYTIQPEIGGIKIILTGFHDKFQSLLENIIQSFQNNLITEDRFEVLKDIEKQESINYLQTIGVTGQARLKFEKVFQQYAQDRHDNVQLIDSLDIRKLEQFSKSYLDHLYLKGLVSGNINSTDATKAIEKIEGILKSKILDKSEYFIERILNINGSVVLRLPQQEFIDGQKRNVVINYYQIGWLTSTKQSAMIQIAKQIFYDLIRKKLEQEDVLGVPNLRTELQITTQQYGNTLGYLVIFIDNDMKFQPHAIDAKINNAVKYFVKYINEDMKYEEFDLRKQQRIHILETKAPTLQDQTINSFFDIQNGIYDFKWSSKVITQLKQYDLAMVQDFYKDTLQVDDPQTEPKYMRFSYQIYGNITASAFLPTDVYPDTQRLFIKRSEMVTYFGFHHGVPFDIVQ